jgi:hypothetical protein
MAAREANLIVDMDSSQQSSVGEIVAIKYVMQLPPMESYSSLVSFDSLNGM